MRSNIIHPKTLLYYQKKPKQLICLIHWKSSKTILPSGQWSPESQLLSRSPPASRYPEDRSPATRGWSSSKPLERSSLEEWLLGVATRSGFVIFNVFFLGFTGFYPVLLRFTVVLVIYYLLQRTSTVWQLSRFFPKRMDALCTSRQTGSRCFIVDSVSFVTPKRSVLKISSEEIESFRMSMCSKPRRSTSSSMLVTKWSAEGPRFSPLSWSGQTGHMFWSRSLGIKTSKDKWEQMLPKETCPNRILNILNTLPTRITFLLRS